MLLAALGVLGACGGDDAEPVDLTDSSAERDDLAERIEDAERRLERLRERERKDSGKPREPNGLRGVDRLLTSLDAEVGLTAGPPGSAPAHAAGGLRIGSAWSTIKVPIALRVIQRAGGVDALGAAQREQIERAITASDNQAAARLFASLGAVGTAAREVEDVLREAGDDETRVSTQSRGEFSPYGQTNWSLERQHRFIAALAAGCIGQDGSADYLLDLMGRVTSDRWGLGSVGVPARWKGGWGPGTDGRYLVRQMGVIEASRGPLVVTLAAIPHDGSFESGQRVATAVARWLREHAAGLAGPGNDC
ncbi:MAG TPA: serine hydrolase [Thermoleophilaceae bacterium]|jgi:hypothetical protein